ncbi:hypothetical protein ABW19_dt0205786 [Dactylella cylindrospora]|nr:hypothetical protein ABW19_dt0205786 [Dactylella cylindrospora]
MDTFPPVPSPFTPRLPHRPLPPATTTNTIGLLTTHLLPSLTLHTSLSLVAYSAGRFTNRLDSKDLLWPSSLLVNAWYHGIVHPYMFGRAKGVWECLRDMGYSQKLILGGVSVWGVRLFVKVFMKVKGRRRDDGRYEKYRVEAARTVKEGGDGEVEREMWNKAFLGIFLPEAVVQSFVSLGWSVLRYSRRVVGSPMTGAATVTGTEGLSSIPVVEGVVTGGGGGLERWRGYMHMIAIATFAAGLALEMIADSQLKRGKRRRNEDGGMFDGLVRDGVWSIVRHPNYLGDFLVHLSFPLLALADGIFNPVMFLGPVTNYIFLRFIGGDKETEEYQMEKYEKENPKKYQELLEWKKQKNSFWPGWRELGNPWTWAIVGIGAVAAGVEWFAGSPWRVKF